MVVNGAQLGSYSQAREMLLPYMYDGLPLHAAAAMIAGFVTTVASLPVDIVKTSIFYVASVRTSLQECQLKISVGYLFCPAYNEVATRLA